MNKHTKLLVSVVALASLCFVSVAQAASFPDVPETSKYYKAVEYFYKIQAIKGYEDGSFQPDRPVNRAEALKMVFAGSPKSFVLRQVIDTDLFPDVTKDAWFAPYIQKALELKIVAGNSDGSFAPARNVNKAELLKMLLLANEVSVENYKTGANLSGDVQAGAWFYPYMAYAKEFAIIGTNINGDLEPAKALTRGEVALIMYKYIVNVKGGKVQQLLSQTEATLLEAMDKVANKDFEAARTLSKETVDLAMEAYKLAPDQLIVKDAAKAAKAFNFLVEGFIAVNNKDLAGGKASLEAAIAKAEEITHPSVTSLKSKIIQLAKKVQAQVLVLESA